MIGTLSLRADEQGIATCVISHDRDAFQLVSDNVCVLLSPRGVTDVHVYTPDRVEARYGIPPRLVPDFIGLKGDTSDDIPGVPGIGDKTASELLVRFGSLEGIYANVDAVPGREAAPDADRAPRGRRSARSSWPRSSATSSSTSTSRRRWPTPPDRATMGELFRRFEFRALLRRIDELEAAVPGAVVEREEHARRRRARRRRRAAPRCWPTSGPVGLAGDGDGRSGSRAAARRC